MIRVSILWSYWRGIPIPPVQIVIRWRGRIVWLLDREVGT